MLDGYCLGGAFGVYLFETFIDDIFGVRNPSIVF